MDQAELERPYSRQWWESRTSSELQDMLRSGLASGDVGVEAHREIERRAQELGKAEEQKVEEKAARGAVFRLQILGGALAVLLVLLVVMKLVR
jgi:hypothetical protein